MGDRSRADRMAFDPTSVDLRLLAALVTVADTRSFSRAASLLGFSQPAVSQQIARLERIVGVPLVVRPGGPLPLTLTPAGETFLEHARAVLDRMRQAAADMDAYGHGNTGTLRIGSFQSVGARLVPRLLHDFAETYPQSRIAVRESDDHDVLTTAVRTGDLDMTFVVFPAPIGRFTATHLLVDPYIAILPADDELASSRDPLPIDALRNHDLVTFQAVRFPSTEARLNRPWVGERHIHHANYNSSIIGMVIEGVGVGIVPWLSFDAMSAPVVYRRLLDVPARVVGIAWRSDVPLSPLGEAFIKHARALAEREQERIFESLGQFDLAAAGG